MGNIYKKVEYSRIMQLRFEHQRVWKLRKMYTVYWNMKLKRLIGQEETEPKVAWDRACGWKSSLGRSAYARMLGFEERKAV